MDKVKIINEIKEFLDGYNNDLKYLVHVEADPNENFAECIFHPPGEEKEIVKIEYTPFLYTKDFEKNKFQLFYDDKELLEQKMIQYGIKREKLETGNQKRLEEGYCWKYTSYKSYYSLVNFFRDSGLDPYEKARDDNGRILKDKKDRPIFLYRNLFFSPKPYEQFLIDKKARLFKGFEEYKDIHKLTIDIETTGLRPEISRVFAIGISDNRGFEVALKVDKEDDDLAEANLIRDMFNVITYLKPAIILGHNSEEFDFYYVMGRVKELKMNLSKIPTTLKNDYSIKRLPNSSVKIGSNSEKYTATKMWGFSIIDTLHAAKRNAVLDSDMKSTALKYICKYENIAKENRTYIPGEDNDIARYFHENPVFISNENNEHLEIPKDFQNTATKLLDLQNKKKEIDAEEYKSNRKKILIHDTKFIEWFRKEASPNGYSKFISGKKLLEQYLLDDLWETEQVDELYNQSSFMLAKIVPTTYARICTMGTAGIWNLLLTSWSFEKGLAIPAPDKYDDFPGGLSRCYKKGYIKRLVKIDYASLYPMLQLTWDIFPIFDISGVMKNMLIYMTTTRNIYKKLAKSKKLNDEETILLKELDHDAYVKYTSNTLTSKDRSKFKIKESPIKILNNSQFGALGSNIAFNWSDNRCAARITCCGRLELRHAIKWFEQFDCIPLYAVTDGVNFHIPDKTTIKVTEKEILYNQQEDFIENMWVYNDEKGVNALIEYFNDHEMKGFMSADNDGEFVSCFNLSRINYAVLQEIEDKETGNKKKKIKLTGNTLKSSVLSEYIEDFMSEGWKMILEGKGKEFVDYYYDYVQKLYYKQIPLKKIASKSKYKHTLKNYINRGVDKNGREKGKQAHMELIISERNKIAEELFEKHKNNLNYNKNEDELTVEDKLKLVDVYMPPEPDLDSTIYYYNTGYRKSHGDSAEIKDKETGEYRYASTLINKDQLSENPNLTGEYNVDKYLDAFNKRVEKMLHAFDPEIAEKIPAKIKRKKVKDAEGKKKEEEELVMNYFTTEQLQLKSFDLDDIDESMHLEPKEVKFWNQYGYDPRKVWNGFKMYDDEKVYFEIYENALKFVNNQMKNAGKNKIIKSINDKINKDDLVLLKDGGNYSIGYHNGVYITIKKENISIPKSDVEKELDEKMSKKKDEISKLDNGIDQNNMIEKREEEKNNKRLKYFDDFKKKFKLPDDLTYDNFIEDAGEGEAHKMIDCFIKWSVKPIHRFSVDGM